jgi:ADP-ribose pyrophosphatase YjhB (NUDIX family)
MKRVNFDAARRACEPAIRRLLHLYWRFARAMTLGVRAVVIDPQGRIFLVKHSYVSGWHLPGGGVEAGETIAEALARELREEGNIELCAPPRLHGMYFNDRDSRRDHVALFVVRDFRQTAAPVPDHEIIAHGFFAVSELPSDTTAGTRTRILEVLGDAPARGRW